jgi:D-threonate/D-erythronate kinase
MQIPGQSIGILADDMTGACDTGLQFHVEGAIARILMDPNAELQAGSTDAWLLKTDSRHMTENTAAETAKSATLFMKDRLQLERFYKKMDSTLRGHFAHEALAMLETLSWKAAIIAPAYPDQGRQTIGGYQMIKGVPVGQTEIARDPLFPVRESHLPTLLAQQAHPDWVGHISLAVILEGAGPILKSIQEQITLGKRLIVADACSDTDLEQLSLAINKMPFGQEVLPCGSGGLAKALSKKWMLHLDRPKRAAIAIQRSPMLLVIGSASEQTREQVELLLKELPMTLPNSTIEILHVLPSHILGLESVDSLVRTAIEKLNQHINIIISTSTLQDTLNKTLLLAEEYNMGPAQACEKATALLAELTRKITLEAPCKLLLSGGETAGAVAKLLGIGSIQIVSELETSIPLMIDDHARWIVTKSGSFGSARCLLNIFKTLRDMELDEQTPCV